jgi:nitrogen fixation/metabolism regulation signal transduction histidine kinase
MSDFYNSTVLSVPAAIQTELTSEALADSCQVAELRRALAEAQAALRCAEQRLADQKEYYQSVLDHLKVNVAVFDAEQRFQVVNAKSFSDPELREWVIGKTNDEYCEHRGVAPEIGATRRRLLTQVLTTGVETSWEETLMTADGPCRLLRYYVPVLGADGAVRMVVGT